MERGAESSRRERRTPVSRTPGALGSSVVGLALPAPPPPFTFLIKPEARGFPTSSSGKWTQCVPGDCRRRKRVNRQVLGPYYRAAGAAAVWVPRPGACGLFPPALIPVN